ncbi:hypothetical protein YC2023_048197 [Brassica napus]
MTCLKIHKRIQEPGRVDLRVWYDYRAGFWGIMGVAVTHFLKPFTEELNSLGKLAPTVDKLKRGFGMRVPRIYARRNVHEPHYYVVSSQSIRVRLS